MTNEAKRNEAYSPSSCWVVRRTWNSCVHKHVDGHAEVEKVFMQNPYALRVDGKKVCERATWYRARAAYQPNAELSGKESRREDG